eukprot:jgi/Tetstr1/454158/TSEL_041077.t1
MAGGVTMERVIDKIRELEARVRALERMAEDDRTLDDIRTSITMLADSMANNNNGAAADPGIAKERGPDLARRPARAPAPAKGFTALADPRFRVL